MKYFSVLILTAGLALLNFGCAGGKRVTMLEQQIVMLEQKADTLGSQLASVQKERDALSLDKTLQKAELDIVRRDMLQLRAANDSLQALSALPAATEEPITTLAETQSPPKALMSPAHPVAVAQEPVPPPPEDLPVISRSADFQRGYEQALALFNEKKYAPSAQSFTALLESNRNHRLSGNCQYWIGECHYAQGQYENALAEFQKVFAYPNCFKADAAQFKIALCYLQLTHNNEAREEFNRLISAYPNSEYVARARAHLDKLP